MATTRAADMVGEAKQRVENLTPHEVAKEREQGQVRVIDIREKDELQQQGSIPGAVHASQGMLAFYADPSSPYHCPELDPNQRTILYCASGGRSALAAKTL